MSQGLNPTESGYSEVPFNIPTKVGRRSSVNPSEFEFLSKNVEHNITAIMGSTRQLEDHLKMSGNEKDLPAFREKLYSINTKINTRVQTTSQDLQRLEAVLCSDDEDLNMELDFLSWEFEEVVGNHAIQQNQIFLATEQGYPIYASAGYKAKMQQLHKQRQEEAIRQQQQQQDQHDMLVEHRRHVKEAMAKTRDSWTRVKKSSPCDCDDECTDPFHFEFPKRTVVRRENQLRKILISLVTFVIIGIVIAILKN